MIGSVLAVLALAGVFAAVGPTSPAVHPRRRHSAAGPGQSNDRRGSTFALGVGRPGHGRAHPSGPRRVGAAPHRADRHRQSTPVTWFKPRDLLDRSFEVGIILKGLDGLLETIGGILLLLITPAQINTIVGKITRHELSEDPNDWIAGHLLRYAHGLTGSAVTFAAIYLLAHGVVKVVLVVALLRNKMWAYPWLIAVLLAFIGYQLYRIALRPTTGLILLTLFDAAITALTWREWRKQHALRRPGTAGIILPLTP